jgi:hypothetical protein
MRYIYGDCNYNHDKGVTLINTLPIKKVNTIVGEVDDDFCNNTSLKI